MDRDLLAGALASISRKDRTESEIRDWLSAQGADDEMVDLIVSHLIENLAIDDARFAREYARDKRELSGWGDDRIREVLRERGIPRDVIEAAVSCDELSQIDRAVLFLTEKEVEVMDDRSRQRALGMLARRGFSAEDAYAAIRIREGDQAA